jgi:hypothetical protein
MSQRERARTVDLSLFVFWTVRLITYSTCMLCGTFPLTVHKPFSVKREAARHHDYSTIEIRCGYTLLGIANVLNNPGGHIILKTFLQDDRLRPLHSPTTLTSFLEHPLGCSRSVSVSDAHDSSPSPMPTIESGLLQHISLCYSAVFYRSRWP